MNQPTKERNYQRYRHAAWTRPDYYPLNQEVNSALYRPVATWIGRLILNERADRDLDGLAAWYRLFDAQFNIAR